MKHIIERKPKLFIRHLFLFGQSLSHHIEHYAYLFFSITDPTQLVKHHAYLCPLCVEKGVILLNEYFMDNGADFTIDHFPPKSVGGSQTLLVCRDCNSEAGKFENDLKRKLQDRSFDKGVPQSARKIRSTISTVKGCYPGTLKVGVDNKISISFKENEKIHTPLLDNWMAKPVRDLYWTAEIKYFVADEKNVARSMLKTAYLFCFQYWGYSFCFSETGKMLRNVINAKINYPLKNRGFWLTEHMASTDFPLGLCTLTMPRQLKSFCVNVLLYDLNTKHEELFSIIVPGPFQSDWKKLTEIDTLISDDPNFDVSFRKVENFGISDGRMNGYIDAWLDFSGSQP